MTEYTASNGIKVVINGNGSLATTEHGAMRYTLSDVGVAALREFFQHERDEALGRWRSTSDPDFVVYPSSVHRVRVLRESIGSSFEFIKSELTTTVSAYGEAARAYLDTHPEPKPWEDAKPGEVWALTVNGEVVGYTFDGLFRSLDEQPDEPVLGRRAELITAGRRIWPEATS